MQQQKELQQLDIDLYNTMGAGKGFTNLLVKLLGMAMRGGS
jgi:hypothetical protein